MCALKASTADQSPLNIDNSMGVRPSKFLYSTLYNLLLTFFVKNFKNVGGKWSKMR